MIRILQVSAHENLFHEYYKNFDDDNIVFDYVLRDGGEDFKFKNELDNRSKLYYITPLQSNRVKFTLELRRIIKTESYKYIHLHLSYANIFGIIASIGSGVKIISHNHSTYKSRNFILSLLRKLILKPIINLFSDHCLACSIQAGNEMFYKFEIIPNSIDYKKFSFSQNHRNKIRLQFGISDDTFLIGHVGHFLSQKNHQYFIKFLRESKFNIKIKFLLIGLELGTKENFIKELITLNLLEYFIIVDYTNEVHEFYSAFDMYLFPSLYEGFGISLLEAQVNGLKCFYSKSIPNDAIINIESEPIDINDFKNQKLLDYINILKIGIRHSDFDDKYNIKHTFKTLQKIYQT